MRIFWPIILLILLIVSFGLAIYLVKKLGELEMKDFLYAAIGGLGFTVMWLSISMLMNLEPILLLAIVSGVALFFGSLLMRAYLKRSEK